MGPAASTTVLLIAAAERQRALAQHLTALGYDVTAVTPAQLTDAAQLAAADLLVVDDALAADEVWARIWRLAADTPVVTLGGDPGPWAQAALAHSGAGTPAQSATDLLEERARHWHGLNVLDPASLLFTRRYCDAILPLELERARRVHQPLSLLLLQLVGMPAEALPWPTIGQRLLASVRRTDLVARFDRHQALILLPATESTLARIVAARLKQALTTPPIAALDARIGVAAFPQHGLTLEELLAEVQHALDLS
ncbi:diguanylate cyclase domain-containing protein [Kallotenue papyrolyticum]|uniref:diguanylate cyclase domain-containing protein n=1 Tax=Kallotenue papyrolyticum TaxID=1325125 RepID=UPI00047861F1|nr:diguanylate cyclase [Kallotenue papyrolyticum]